MYSFYCDVLITLDAFETPLFNDLELAFTMSPMQLLRHLQR